MSDKAEKTVTLTAPNGLQVTVAESKKDARLAGGYTLPKGSSSGSAKKSTAKKTAAKKAAEPAAQTSEQPTDEK